MFQVARRKFDVKDLAKSMEGIEYNHRESIVDEIPDAYKDIDTVMKNQEDLVEVMAELKQVLSIKGD